MSSNRRTARLLTAALALGCLAGVGCTPAPGGTTTPRANSQPDPPDDDRAAKIYGYRIVATYPHEKSAYTQGLLWDDGYLIETTGRPRQSFVRRVQLETGKALQATQLPGEEFGEGVARWQDVYIQLTWTDGVAIYWDARTLSERYRVEYEGEGWGLTLVGEELVMSDGTSELQFRDPETFELRRKLEVTAWSQRRGRWVAVGRLNELESIDGEIWANIYLDEAIARIDPGTGHITSWIDLGGLPARQNVSDRAQGVLNGIAHDPKTGRLFVTGKLWPNLYVIEVGDEK